MIFLHHHPVLQISNKAVLFQANQNCLTKSLLTYVPECPQRHNASHFVKIRTAPQRETTLRSKWPPRDNATLFHNSHRATTGDHVAIQKLRPYHTRALNHDVLLAQRKYFSNLFKCAKYVAIAGFLAAARHFLITCFKCCVCHAK